RVRLFIDYWNLQLTLNEREARANGTDPRTERFAIDFIRFPKVLVQQAEDLLNAPCAYEGTIVYTSHDNTAEGRKYRNWATNWLDRQVGVQVQCFERRTKHPPKCNHCHDTIKNCPHCKQALSGTVEKGVDTAIVTDMIRLAWEKAYDVGILVSSDADLVPAVQFLDSRSLRIIQAGFPPKGSDLAKASWGSIDLFASKEQYRRT
ncbi:MAG: NYN domain-containing protein, partial [Planctomycetaceae bacterium]